MKRRIVMQQQHTNFGQYWNHVTIVDRGLWNLHIVDAELVRQLMNCGFEIEHVADSGPDGSARNSIPTLEQKKSP
jgi:hypothetical protein